MRNVELGAPGRVSSTSRLLSRSRWAGGGSPPVDSGRRPGTLRPVRVWRWIASALVAANVAVIVALWWDGVGTIDSGAELLATAGRLTGLLGAFVALLALLLIGLGRLARHHAALGRLCLGLLLAHAVLITAGYTVGDGITLWAELGRLVSGYPGVITAIAGLALLVVVAVTSARAARRRMRYETWYFIHLYSYLAVALAFSHQIAAGTAFVGRPVARAYWIALYVVGLGALVVLRLGVPVARSLYHRLHVARIVEEGPGVTSIEIGGRRLERLRARSGQFFTWRFLTRDRWWEAHPFSLSAAPDGRRLRITVKGVGAYTEALRALRPGTRVIAEGPFGGFTAAARRRRRVLLIAGGVGITPIRALLEDMPGTPGDIAVVYRAQRPGDLILREELDALAATRGAELHYVLGERDGDLLSPAHLQELVPDIAERDVYVCGSPAMTAATRVSLDRSGVPGRHIVTERFAF
jgi:predicted ferric reductase